MLKFLTKIALLITVFLAPVLTLTAQASEATKPQPEIRFYKINKDGITQKVLFTKRKARKSGCHNFIKKVRLHRTVQFAYEQCQVFSKKNCITESAISFYKKKQADLLSVKLSEGFGWHPVSQHPRGVKVKSWSCE
jgi:hypothetical protein